MMNVCFTGRRSIFIAYFPLWGRVSFLFADYIPMHSAEYQQEHGIWSSLDEAPLSEHGRKRETWTRTIMTAFLPFSDKILPEY